jgi:tRNA pseudouridine13 synthase
MNEQILQGLPLPFVTGELPGIGGSIKLAPEHFIVDEVPLYEAEGSGPHVYINLTRAGWTTRDVAIQLGRCFDVAVRDIGYAGLKDRQALVTQTFSVPGIDAQAAAARITDRLPFQVNWVRAHRNKLRPGHLLGNRFAIFVADPVADAVPRAEAIARALLDHGLPNFFGPQRFGHAGDNAVQGYQVLLGRGPRQRWLRDLLVSAFQAAVFNLYLVRRLEAGLFFSLLPGDVAKKHATGGLFVVEDAAHEQARFAAREISHTGPIVGSKMLAASGPAGELEAGVMAEVDVSPAAYKKVGAVGSRRFGRLLVADLEISSTTGFWLRFQLPKGAYATNVLREFMKQEVVLAGDDQDDDAEPGR